MDPIQGSIATLLNALRGAAAAPTELPVTPLAALQALAGQEVNLVFLGAGADGQQLALPSGQVLTAQGALDYPEGTQLRMRVLGGTPGTGELRLQTLAAQPPRPAGILTPLLQGEAAELLARLAQPEPGAALAPLAELHQLLRETPAVGNRAAVQAALDALPAPTQAALRAALNVPADAPLGEALEAWLARQAGATPAELDPLLQAVLERHPEAPREALAALLKHPPGSAGEPAARRPGAAPEGPAAAPGSPADRLRAVLAGRAGAPAEQPETWESWIKTSVKTLADPAASPREAPFHLAQAKEGTAFYELPLPWAPQAPLQMWVESDRESSARQGREETRTVLLGLKFTRLGETRLGVAKGPGGLQVRVWTEHPEALAADQAQVEAELQELGAPVDLRILSLQPGPGGFVPSLKSLATGASVRILG